MRVAPFAPGVGLHRVVEAAAGGRAPPILLQRTGRALVEAAAIAAQAGPGTPDVWFDTDGEVTALCPILRQGVRLRPSSRFELACLAPELVRGEQDADEATEVYGVGVALHGLAFGVMPWRRDDDNESLIALLQATLHAPRAVVSETTLLEALIVRCTARERAARPTLAELAAALQGDDEPGDLRPFLAGLCGDAWTTATDVAEQLLLVDTTAAPRHPAKPFDLDPWRAWLRAPPPPGVFWTVPRSRTPTRLPF